MHLNGEGISNLGISNTTKETNVNVSNQTYVKKETRKVTWTLQTYLKVRWEPNPFVLDYLSLLVP